MRTVLTAIVLLSMVLVIEVDRQAIAQGPLPPVDLGIKNIPQQTKVWCWAAVAQQIIQWSRGPFQTPPQCALVAMAYGRHPSVCCSGMGNPNCVRTGSLQQIQYLIGQFGGRFSSLAPPTDPMTIYHNLRSGRAIIMAVRSSPFTNHVVVIRGMDWISTSRGVQPILLINDPTGFFSQPVPFANIARFWQVAIVVY